VLSEVPGVKPLLWTDCFKLGDITFLTIESIARRVAGAAFLATPDDDSIIREQRVRTPRANVLFEYGYLSAMLTRRRVALCRYTTAELPSDFAGVTYVPMGSFEPTRPLEEQVKTNLRSWATELPAVQVGVSPTSQMHGYSGTWKAETVYEVYRRIPLKAPDYAIINGTLMLQIAADGNSGTGCLYGTLQIQVGACYAEFEMCDLVVDAKVLNDGSLKLRNEIQTRQLIKLEGDPPQRDGFQPEYRGARVIDVIVQCPADEPGVLRARLLSEVGGNIYSKATGKWTR
jgi:hypothetical protein